MRAQAMARFRLRLSTPPLPPPSPHSVYTNPPLCVLILHIIAFCFRLEQQFMIFCCSNLHSRGPQLQVPPLLGSSSPSTSSVGTDAYRQKAILPTSYQASPEIYEGVDCKDDSPGCFTGAHNLSFAHTGTKIAEMIQRPYSHGPWKRHPVQAGARTSFERLCLAGNNRCDLHSRKRGRTLPALALKPQHTAEKQKGGIKTDRRDLRMSCTQETTGR